MTQCVPEGNERVGSSPPSARVDSTHDAHDDVVRLRNELAGMEIAMHTRASIEQAKGILMGRYEVDDLAAFSILRRWSMTTNLKIRDLARALIEITAHRTTVSTANKDALAAVHTELCAAVSRTVASESPRTR